MKTKRPVKFLLTAAAVLLLGLLLAKPGYYAYRELEYRFGTPTAGETKVHTYAKENGIPYGAYPKDLIELLDNNPEAEGFVVKYPFREDILITLSAYDRKTVPLFLQWDPMWGYAEYGSSFLAVTGCGPTCLAMVGYYLTADEVMNPKTIAEYAESWGYYAPGYGSSWTLISEGAEKLGLKVQELPLVKKKMTDALEAGSPIILAMGQGDFTTTGHYIVLTGYENGAFTVNDPNSRIRSRRTWTYEELEWQIRNIWKLDKA